MWLNNDLQNQCCHATIFPRWPVVVGGMRSDGFQLGSICISWCAELIFNWLSCFDLCSCRNVISSLTWHGWLFCILNVSALLLLNLSNRPPQHLSFHCFDYCCELFNGQMTFFCYLLTPCCVIHCTMSFWPYW